MACSCDKKKVMKHLKEDVKTYKREAKDDRKLMKDLKSDKHEKKESKAHERKENKKEKKIKKVIREFDRGELHSGSKNGPVVKDKKQALAIGYSEAKKAQKDKKKK